MKITEEEIRPERIFDEYLALTARDVVTYFADVQRTEIDCPVCNIPGELWAEKDGFTYKECGRCFSIFVSPRPDKTAFVDYYTDSPSTKFWATTFYKVTEQARREKLWKPKAEQIKRKIEKFQGHDPINCIVDIGGGYGVFDEEINKIMDVQLVVIEPSVHLAQICRDKGLAVVEKFVEDITPDDLPAVSTCFVSFELFEHLHDPAIFLDTVYARMRKGDLFIFTTLSGMGVDIQVLGKHARALSPPHHLNFLNPKSVTQLLQNIGFEVLEAATPGKLDIDILQNNKHFIKEPFWKNVLGYCSEDELANIQQLIAENGLSSHMMITCKK